MLLTTREHIVALEPLDGRLDAGVLLLPKPYASSDLARMPRIALAA